MVRAQRRSRLATLVLPRRRSSRRKEKLQRWLDTRSRFRDALGLKGLARSPESSQYESCIANTLAMPSRCSLPPKEAVFLAGRWAPLPHVPSAAFAQHAVPECSSRSAWSRRQRERKRRLTNQPCDRSCHSNPSSPSAPAFLLHILGDRCARWFRKRRERKVTYWIYRLKLPIEFTYRTYLLNLPTGFTYWIYLLDSPTEFTYCMYLLLLPIEFIAFTYCVYLLNLPTGFTY